MTFDFKPVPKPRHKRFKPKRGQHSKITKNVRDEVLKRSGGRCERCGRRQAYGMEMAHLKQASQGGSGKENFNVALLCGPSVNTGTCHWFADSTALGREWRMQKREELKQYYGEESE